MTDGGSRSSPLMYIKLEGGRRRRRCSSFFFHCPAVVVVHGHHQYPVVRCIVWLTFSPCPFLGYYAELLLLLHPSFLALLLPTVTKKYTFLLPFAVRKHLRYPTLLPGLSLLEIKSSFFRLDPEVSLKSSF